MNTFLIIGMQLRTITIKPERLARLHIVASFQKKLHLYTEIFHLQNDTAELDACAAIRLTRDNQSLTTSCSYAIHR